MPPKMRCRAAGSRNFNATLRGVEYDTFLNVLTVPVPARPGDGVLGDQSSSAVGRTLAVARNMLGERLEIRSIEGIDK